MLEKYSSIGSQQESIKVFLAQHVILHNGLASPTLFGPLIIPFANHQF